MSLTPAQQRDAKKALEEAVHEIGGPKVVGALFGISGQAVSQWTVCPSDYVIELSRRSEVSATRLRPDLYPKGTVLPERKVA